MKSLSSFIRRFMALYNSEKYFFGPALGEGLVLNYGCGNRKSETEIGVDISSGTDADVMVSANPPSLPFKEAVFDAALSRYVLEHVVDLESLMKEVSRVLKPGGMYRFVVPHAFSRDAYDDPTHVRFFTSATPQYFVGKANVYYSEQLFSSAWLLVRVTLSFPRVRIIRWPINGILILLSAVSPRIAEEMIKMPFMTGALFVELRK